MADFPDSLFSPTYVGSLSGVAAIQATAGLGGAISSGLGWTANRAVYIPIFIPSPFKISRFFWWPGTVACNVDLGVYTAGGARLISTGSTASGQSNHVEYITPGSPPLLTPGRYYLALACDTTNATGLFNTASSTMTNVVMRLAGCLQQASAFPLPDPMSPAALSIAIYPWFGITQT